MKPDVQEYGMEFFHRLSDQLKANGVPVETEWGGDFPKVRKMSCSENGEGFYFRKGGAGAFQHFTQAQTQGILNCFPFEFDGLAVKLGGICEAETDLDEDRSWPPCIEIFPMSLEEYNTYFDKQAEGEMQRAQYESM
jgi:hypothetical protein